MLWVEHWFTSLQKDYKEMSDKSLIYEKPLESVFMSEVMLALML